MKEHFKTCILYIKDVSNVGFWIMNEHNQKQQRLDTSAVIRLRGRKKQPIFDVSQLSRQDKDKMTKLAAMV